MAQPVESRRAALRAPGEGPSRIARFAAVSGAAFAVSLPWWGFNLWLSGSLMPSSGTAPSAASRN